jgi:hypothetical protein
MGKYARKYGRNPVGEIRTFALFCAISSAATIMSWSAMFSAGI